MADPRLALCGALQRKTMLHVDLPVLRSQARIVGARAQAAGGDIPHRVRVAPCLAACGALAANRQKPKRPSHLFHSRSGSRLSGRESNGERTTVKAMSDGGKPQFTSFQEFLLYMEDTKPLWWRLSDLYLNFLGGFCFYFSVVEPDVANRYFLTSVQDVVNVNFLIKFVLLFWANDFKNTWFFTPKAALDFASCLPVLGILARLLVGPAMEKTFDILQLFRFLRLLTGSLPGAKTSSVAEVSGQQTGTRGSLQVITVILSLLGSLVVSATLLFRCENVQARDGSLMQSRSFDDTMLFMVNTFGGREPPFQPRTSEGKQVTVVATLVGTLFVPFLISEFLDILTQGRNLRRLGSGLNLPMSQEQETFQGDWEVGPAAWAQVLRRIDFLEKAEQLSDCEAKALRGLCRERDAQTYLLDVCYGEVCKEGAPASVLKLYACRLRERLADRERKAIAELNGRSCNEGC